MNALDEQDVKYLLSQQLEQCGYDVYWEQQNDYEYDTFHSDQQARPDILARGEHVFMIEVKSGDRASQTYNAMLQNQQYIESYANGQEYSAEGGVISIDGFVVANRYTPRGTLFRDDPILEQPHHSNGRRVDVAAGVLPDVEGRLTEMFVRLQWRLLKDSPVDGVGSGALLSTALDGDDDAGPALLWWRDSGQEWDPL